MKRLVELVLLLSFSLIFSQEEYNEYSVFDFQVNSNQKILIDQTKVRHSPDLRAEILDSLRINQDIKIVTRTKEVTQIGERFAPWFKISYQQDGSVKNGFVWGGNIALGHRKYQNTQFIFGIASTQKIKNKDDDEYHNEMIARVVALQQDSVISERNFEMGNAENLNVFGFKIVENKNLKNVDCMVVAMVSGAACAIPTYEQYFLWSQNRFIKLPRLMQVSDAGIFSYSEKFQFNKTGKITVKIEQYEKDEERNKETTQYSSKQYFWNGKNFK